MKTTQEQYEKIEKYLPKQRGNVKIDNFQFLNAILYVVEKWVQVEDIAKRIRQVAYDIHAHEPLEQKWRSQQNFCRLAR